MDDKNYGWPTTRRYPRTTKEAFPNDIENAQWWFPPEQRWQDKLLFAVGVVMWVVLSVYLFKSN
jgi:hypothetical protein